MDWQQFKQCEISELLTDISRLSIQIDDKEITDYTLCRKLELAQNKIGLFINKINNQRIVDLNKKQESLC